MPTYYNNVSMKLESALKALIDAEAIEGLTVNTGISDQDIEMPCCICSAERGQEEEIKDSGIFKIKSKLTVKSSAENDEQYAALAALVGRIFDVALNDEAAANLSGALDDFHCYDITRMGGDERIEDKIHVIELILDCVCCGSDISDN